MKQKITHSHTATRFSRVSVSVRRLAAVVLLFPTFFMPLAPIFASEETSVSVEPVMEEDLEKSSDVEAEIEEPQDDEEIDQIAEVEEDIVEVEAVAGLTESVTGEESSINESETVIEESVEIPVDTELPSDSEALDTTEVGIVISDESEAQDDTMTATDENLPEEQTIVEQENTNIPTTTVEISSTTSQEIAGEVDLNQTVQPDGEFSKEVLDENDTPVTSIKERDTEVINIIYNDENRYTFSKDQCVSMGEGAFYCAENTEIEQSHGSDRVFSSRDADGDLEIYLEVGGEVTAITNNTIDDDAPFYDEVSNTIVWHRLMDGRYQIIEFDIDKNEESELTHERYNNMQPSRSGDVVVWQGWIGDDWEIMMDNHGEFSMLTDNTIHDIDPHINGSYIIWQSFEDNVWRAKVYNLETEKIETISDSEGGSVQNPRFVLVYDTKLENGDVETKGYDFETKSVVPLSAEPAPVPTKIPDPDDTGEKKALVGQNLQLKPKSDSENDSEPDDSLDPMLSGTTTPFVSEEDLIISPYAEIGTDTESDSGTSTSVTRIMEGDLNMRIDGEVLTPTSSPSHIEDLVIMPFLETLEEGTDSQSPVASSL